MITTSDIMNAIKNEHIAIEWFVMAVDNAMATWQIEIDSHMESGSDLEKNLAAGSQRAVERVKKVRDEMFLVMHPHTEVDL